MCKVSRRFCEIVALAWVVLFTNAHGFAGMLDSLAVREDLWKLSRAEFVSASPGLGFHWVSAAQDSAETRLPGLTLFGLPVYQAVAQLDGDKVKTLTVSFYNRGDAGDLPKDQFQALLHKVMDALGAATKSQPALRGRDASSAVKADGMEWQNGATKFLLEYSFTREVKSPPTPFRAEFVRLQVSPVEKPKSMLAESLAVAKPAEKFDGRAHVKRDAASGDVVLEGVPLVDQGEKGYCVVASAERVMRYYGVRTDEHELAQLANSSATTGTSPTAMMESLKKLANRLRVKTREIEPFGVPQLLALVNRYNVIAKRERAPVIDTSSHVLDVGAIYSQMKPDILREARTKNRSDADRFMRAVQARIDTGVPLLWSVMLGIVPEPKAPAGFGGHMRLIIGYNTKTGEVLYSDSWGIGHELKRMPLLDAWTITTGVDAIEPL